MTDSENTTNPEENQLVPKERYNYDYDEAVKINNSMLLQENQNLKSGSSSFETYAIKRKIEVSCVPTPTELAEVFCSMGGDEQALFFENVYSIAASWDRPFVFQLESIVSSHLHTEDGRSIMSDIGDYSGQIKD